MDRSAVGFYMPKKVDLFNSDDNTMNLANMQQPAAGKAIDQQGLIQQALDGDAGARQQINAWVDPLIRFHSARMCKRFCKENRYRYRCTLPEPFPSTASDAALCEWGNGSYAWMLDELTRDSRLKRYRADNNASFYDYAYCIANSLPFYERWKDWRFGRRGYVPSYIVELHPQASAIFYALKQQDVVELIAQNLQLSLQVVEDIAQKIIDELIKRRRLHLLNYDSQESINSDEDTENPTQLADTGADVDSILQSEELQSAWQQLDAVEQFVLEALVIDEQDANDVLAALKQLDIAIHPKTAPADTNRQQLYYFKRKTLAKLLEFMTQ